MLRKQYEAIRHQTIGVSLCLCLHSFIHLFITEIYIVPLQGYYSKAKKNIFQARVEFVVHVFVCSHIDYCNSLLLGIQNQHRPLQSVLNT